ITNVLFTPDGDMVTVGCNDMTTSCTIQEPGKAKPRNTFKLARPKAVLGGQGISAAVLSPDDSMLAVWIDGTITVYHINAGIMKCTAAAAVPDNVEVFEGFAPQPRTVELAFAPSKDKPKLLAIESGYAKKKDLVIARLFDLKTKETTSRTTIFEKAAKVANGI